MASKDDINTLLNKLDNIENKLDGSIDEMKSDIKVIGVRLNSLDITSHKQNVALEEHMRRTDLLEQATAKLHTNDSAVQKSLSDRIVPLEQNVAMWAGAGKLIAVLTGLAALIGAVWKLVELK